MNYEDETLYTGRGDITVNNAAESPLLASNDYMDENESPLQSIRLSVDAKMRNGGVMRHSSFQEPPAISKESLPTKIQNLK